MHSPIGSDPEISFVLSIPLIRQLRTSVKCDQTAVFEALSCKDMLHDFVFILRIDPDRIGMIYPTEILYQIECFS